MGLAQTDAKAFQSIWKLYALFCGGPVVMLFDEAEAL